MLINVTVYPIYSVGWNNARKLISLAFNLQKLARRYLNDAAIYAW
jgi:hypothetical protein